MMASTPSISRPIRVSFRLVAAVSRPSSMVRCSSASSTTLVVSTSGISSAAKSRNCSASAPTVDEPEPLAHAAYVPGGSVRRTGGPVGRVSALGLQRLGSGMRSTQ